MPSITTFLNQKDILKLTDHYFELEKCEIPLNLFADDDAYTVDGQETQLQKGNYLCQFFFVKPFYKRFLFAMFV